jgi:hypothetical protein
MRFRLAFAMLIASFVTGLLPTVASASMFDGHDGSCGWDALAVVVSLFHR